MNNFFISRLEYLHPGIYWLIAIVFFVLIMLYCHHARNTTRNGPMIFLLLFSAMEAFWVYGYKHPSILAFVISTFVVFLLVSLSYTCVGEPLFQKAERVKEKAERAKEKNEAVRLLNAHRFKEAINIGVNADVLSQVRNPDVVCELAEYEAQRNDNDPGLSHALAEYGLNTEIRRKIILDGQNDVLRTVFFERYGEWYGNQDLLIKLAPNSPRAMKLLKENIGNTKEPDKLHRAIKAIGGLNNERLITAVFSKLTYPEFRKELLEIVTSVNGMAAHIRVKALDKIPPDDEAYAKRYCPYCGSTHIDTTQSYLGLKMDMYYYGYKCYSCGHQSSAPEGMGEAKRFDVSLAELCGRYEHTVG